MKLLRSTQNKINKGKKGKNVPDLEITKVMPVHCHVINNSYQQNFRVLYAFVVKNRFLNY